MDEFKGKKHFIIKSEKNIFRHHFSWHEFDNYLNQIKVGQWDRTPQLQVVLPNGNKWCKKKSKEQYSREQLSQLVQTLEQVIFVLNNTYIPEKLREDDERISFFLS